MRITAAATTEIGRLSHVRLGLCAGGCCGTYYRFTRAPSQPGDIIMAVGEGILSLEPAAYAIVRGSLLDYGAGLKPPRFRILRNSNTPLRCPCGRSFWQPYPGRPTAQCQAYQPMEWLAKDPV